LRFALALTQLLTVTKDEEDQTKTLREEAARVIALLPPPTPEQLRRLARIWPPRPDGSHQ